MHTTALPPIVSRDEWLTARKALLEKEKEHTRAQDQLNAERRRLPMVLVDKAYQFEGPEGPVSLLDLFEGRQQLVMHHIMYGPDDPKPCSGCSELADSIGKLGPLHKRNTTLVAVSRAPFARIAALTAGKEVSFPWYSSYGSDFNYDFHTTLDTRVAPLLLNYRTEEEVAQHGTHWSREPWSEDLNGREGEGTSAFLRVGDQVYHTYSTFSRGMEGYNIATRYLDITALGRSAKLD